MLNGGRGRGGGGGTGYRIQAPNRMGPVLSLCAAEARGHGRLSRSASGSGGSIDGRELDRRGSSGQSRPLAGSVVRRADVREARTRDLVRGHRRPCGGGGSGGGGGGGGGSGGEGEDVAIKFAETATSSLFKPRVGRFDAHRGLEGRAGAGGSGMGGGMGGGSLAAPPATSLQQPPAYLLCFLCKQLQRN